MRELAEIGAKEISRPDDLEAIRAILSDGDRQRSSDAPEVPRRVFRGRTVGNGILISLPTPSAHRITCLAALLCFINGFLARKGSDPGPALTAVMGILLVRKAVIITPEVRSCDPRRMHSGWTHARWQPQVRFYQRPKMPRHNAAQTCSAEGSSVTFR